MIADQKAESRFLPKKEHVHIVTDSKHKELLGNLGERHGSMTKAFERAIEYFEKAESIGSCDNCNIKSEFERAEQFKELLNVVSFTADNIHELIKYLKGDCTAQELLIRSREKAYQFGKQYLSLLDIYPENNYDNLLVTVEEWRKRTRFFKVIQVDRFSKKIIARVNVLEDLPVFVLTGFLGYIESLNFTFDIELFQADVILKWVPPERYAQIKEEINQRVLTYIQDTEESMKPFLLKEGLMLINPDLLDWIGENFFNYRLVPIAIAYDMGNLLVDEDREVVKTAKTVYKICVDNLKRLNYVEELSGSFNDEKNSFKLRIFFRTPHLANLIIQSLIMIVGKWGWKLTSHRIESKRCDLKLSYVGKDDPTILESLYIINFSGYLNQRFQKLRVIPLDEYSDLRHELYELAPERFYQIFKKQGLKIANAIKLLAKNDLKKMIEIAYQVIPQALKQSHRDPKGIDFIPEYQKFTMIFKETNIIDMEQFRAVMSGVAEGFGYSEIKSKIIENMVIIEFLRPGEL